MARSFSNAKLFSASIVEGLSVFVNRRGYAAAAAASQGIASESVRSSVMLKKGGEDSKKNTSWIPDPVTGYYRPENQAKEIDAAELREILLKHKIRRH